MVGTQASDVRSPRSAEAIDAQVLLTVLKAIQSLIMTILNFLLSSDTLMTFSFQL